MVGLIYLVSLVHLVSLVQPNKQDKPNKPNNGLRLNPIGFHGNQNRFSRDGAHHVLHLRVSLRHRENQPILNPIKKDFSKPATEASGTLIAICLNRQQDVQKGCPARPQRVKG